MRSSCSGNICDGVVIVMMMVVVLVAEVVAVMAMMNLPRMPGIKRFL